MRTTTRSRRSGRRSCCFQISRDSTLGTASRPEALTLPDATGRALAAYLEDVLTQAKARARERGDRLLRAADLSEALQGVAPYTVNDLEDVTFFPRLAPEQQVTLAAYDLDSYRDFGLHWKMLQAILAGQPDLMDMEPDPFAAELIAEGVAQYSVLLFRIAGRLAAQGPSGPFSHGKAYRCGADKSPGSIEAECHGARGRRAGARASIGAGGEPIGIKAGFHARGDRRFRDRFRASLVGLAEPLSS